MLKYILAKQSPLKLILCLNKNPNPQILHPDFHYISSGNAKALFLCMFYYAAYPRMCVLDIEDRVFRRLLLCKFRVKVKLCIRFSCQEDEPAGILTHLIYYLS